MKRKAFLVFTATLLSCPQFVMAMGGGSGMQPDFNGRGCTDCRVPTFFEGVNGPSKGFTVVDDGMKQKLDEDRRQREERDRKAAQVEADRIENDRRAKLKQKEDELETKCRSFRDNTNHNAGSVSQFVHNAGSFAIHNPELFRILHRFFNEETRVVYKNSFGAVIYLVEPGNREVVNYLRQRFKQEHFAQLDDHRQNLGQAKAGNGDTRFACVGNPMFELITLSDYILNLK